MFQDSICLKHFLPFSTYASALPVWPSNAKDPWLYSVHRLGLRAMLDVLDWPGSMGHFVYHVGLPPSANWQDCTVPQEGEADNALVERGYYTLFIAMNKKSYHSMCGHRHWSQQHTGRWTGFLVQVCKQRWCRSRVFQWNTGFLQVAPLRVEDVKQCCVISWERLFLQFKKTLCQDVICCTPGRKWAQTKTGRQE